MSVGMQNIFGCLFLVVSDQNSSKIVCFHLVRPNSIPCIPLCYSQKSSKSEPWYSLRTQVQPTISLAHQNCGIDKPGIVLNQSSTYL